MPNDRFIDGIFNYCDRWCERCAYRRRCRSFAMENERTARMDQQDSAARDAGEEPAERVPMPPPKRRRISRKHPDNPLLAAAGRYMDVVTWFITKHQHQKVPRAIREPHEVIAWYQMFIYVKLTRACGQLKHERRVKPQDSDANGSAKIALIGVERSIEAWSQIRDARPKLAAYASRRIADLAKVRVLIEQAFPKCRLFIRAGFDTHPVEEG